MSKTKTSNGFTKFPLLLIGLCLIAFLGLGYVDFNTAKNQSRAVSAFGKISQTWVSNQDGLQIESARLGLKNAKSENKTFTIPLKPSPNFKQAWNLQYPQNKAPLQVAPNPGSTEAATHLSWDTFWLFYANHCASSFKNTPKPVTGSPKSDIWASRTDIYCYDIYSQLNGAFAYQKKMSVPTLLTIVFFGKVLLILAITSFAGLWHRHGYRAAIINAQDRISLEKLQMVFWTAIILGTVSTYSFYNVGLLAANNSQIANTDLFTAIPGALIALMGISIAVPGVAAVLYAGKDEDVEDKDKALSALHNNNLPPAKLDKSGPSYSQLVSKLTEDGRDEVDFSALQNLLITMLLMSFYITLIITIIKGVQPASLLLANQHGMPLFSQLPDIGATFTALLGISHVAYLTVRGLAKGGGDTTITPLADPVPAPGDADTKDDPPAVP